MMIHHPWRMKKMGRHLTRLRTNRGLSLLAMSDETGIPVYKLITIEQGLADISLLTLNAMARALRMKMGEVIVR